MDVQVGGLSGQEQRGRDRPAGRGGAGAAGGGGGPAGRGKENLKSRAGPLRPARLCRAPAAREGALAVGELTMGPRSPRPAPAPPPRGGLVPSRLEPPFLIDNFFLSSSSVGLRLH